ncbi:hypothetical protein HBI82_019380 [Parastagonospora nodorum]|nr:hypothetical protein HBH49_034050 [Parastagonospora nodorum]KAH4237834.1 hypothetical protein HBI05_126290 [Parastagonospora nodorum]KAH4238539.1 hypothetical protein HBI06_041680 [Parastagonospora nodorum]KAH6013459.1 hypothetical protein HBI84_017310 [Parastagonospora nodorum]KAH6021952.1 hypothetical protein HBI83_093750 [Parastagonospora nodorum]
MHFFRSKPVAYTDPSVTPGYETPAMKKRREDEETVQRRVSAPQEAHPEHQSKHGIDKWDFVTPGQSAEEQKAVADIYKLFGKTVERSEQADSKEKEIVLRAGFRDDEPATYRYFIAGYGTREELTHASDTRSSYVLVMLNFQT